MPKSSKFIISAIYHKYVQSTKIANISYSPNILNLKNTSKFHKTKSYYQVRTTLQHNPLPLYHLKVTPQSLCFSCLMLLVNLRVRGVQLKVDILFFILSYQGPGVFYTKILLRTKPSAGARSLLALFENVCK